jgi:hypothetical protein
MLPPMQHQQNSLFYLTAVDDRGTEKTIGPLTYNKTHGYLHAVTAAS